MKIVDNYLDENYFNSIRNFIISDEFSWFHAPYLNEDQPEEDAYTYFTHLVFFEHEILSPAWNLVKDIAANIPDLHALLRVKVNLYPKENQLVEHAKHVDYKFKHKGAIFSLNTCDGFTRLEDGTKVESVANRLLLFDPSKIHNSTSTTTPPGRFNININYL